MVPANVTAQPLGGSLAVVFMSGTEIDTKQGCNFVKAAK